jgi:glutaminyl-tRNA synthetase
VLVIILSDVNQGVVISADTVRRIVLRTIEENKQALLEQRYKFYGNLLKLVRAHPELKWANGKLIKDIVDDENLKILGPKTEADNAKPVSAKPAPKPVQQKVEEVKQTTSEDDWEFKGEITLLHKPGGNPQLHASIIKKHLEETGGKVVTRFPPEPNGFLHIGHAKAINVDFRYAAKHNGICYLRFDDTNPEAEDPVFFEAIKDNVKWLGFTPFKITHSSDYFDQLYEYAVELIKRDKAYVCHQTPEEIFKGRGGADHGPRIPSPWRNRPIEESLKLFEDMKNDKFEEGKAILRMKMDLESGNPNMWDLVAYRILKKPHARTGDKWCIYPTYDFTHPLCDSLENVTHSFCTKEFILNRENYYWLCDALEVYKPVQWEFGRLNITNTVLSKRKLTTLVEKKIVNGWDDPRLYTLMGLKRRGFTANAMNNFVKEVGITTNDSTVEDSLLEACVRNDLNLNAPRLLGVLNPLKVTIIDYPDNEVEEFDVPNFPNDESKGTHKVPFSRTIYIDRSDFREDDVAGYKRLAPGKTVGLLYASYNITCTDYKTDEKGEVTELIAICDRDVKKTKKAKAYIQWVAKSQNHQSPIAAEVRLINSLFSVENPFSGPDDWLTKINPKSMEICNAYVSIGARHCKPGDHFQFQRVAYFCVDPDSTKDKLVFNRTVTLKEDPKANV